ncbi:helix-turn-helix domain-containing protein [Frigoribacterium sp. Leaf172]|uniref:helix-turn-helix domain-containing protein n=1 Tax=Frigoribacterium sp. Leaf172 TaxID=1736285 RepID=UPI0006F921FE|nr:helix-turn-helix domain-containing protein [Frigoribacterium sp. Leaf172]KQR63944.1 hypothetical protein ASF89_12735 [Frigoribacterium sp. Leaf172]
MADAIYSVVQLGALLRNERQRRHLTQAAAAKAAGVERQWLSRLESGKAPGASISAVIEVLESLDLRLAVQAGPAEDESRLFGGDW